MRGLDLEKRCQFPEVAVVLEDPVLHQLGCYLSTCLIEIRANLGINLLNDNYN
jgi:hypothetical protein